MASNEGTPRGVVLLLAIALVATVVGFVVLLTGSTALGGVLLIAGAICSGAGLRLTRRG